MSENEPLRPLPAAALEEDAARLGRPSDGGGAGGSDTHLPASERDHVADGDDGGEEEGARADLLPPD